MTSKATKDFIHLMDVASQISTILQLGGFKDDGSTIVPHDDLVQVHLIDQGGLRYTLTVARS